MFTFTTALVCLIITVLSSVVPHLITAAPRSTALFFFGSCKYGEQRWSACANRQLLSYSSIVQPFTLYAVQRHIIQVLPWVSCCKLLGLSKPPHNLHRTAGKGLLMAPTATLRTDYTHPATEGYCRSNFQPIGVHSPCESSINYSKQLLTSSARRGLHT